MSITSALLPTERFGIFCWQSHEGWIWHSALSRLSRLCHWDKFVDSLATYTMPSPTSANTAMDYPRRPKRLRVFTVMCGHTIFFHQTLKRGIRQIPIFYRYASKRYEQLVWRSYPLTVSVRALENGLLPLPAAVVLRRASSVERPAALSVCIPVIYSNTRAYYTMVI
jgi:hypothetical protein